MVARLQNPAATSAEDVVVRRVSTPGFSGSLAVVGIQACDWSTGVFRGLQFFDVSKPRRPRLLGRWSSSRGGAGCHEIDVTTRGKDRVFAACADAYAEQVSGKREVVVIDVTNPRKPVRTSGWGLKANTGVDPATNPENAGCFMRESLAHSVRFADRGRTLYASYWDRGLVRLDVRTGGKLRYVTRTDIAPPDEDGDVHSVAPAKGGALTLINSEDFSPLNECAKPSGWGEVHIYANSRETSEHLSVFSTRNSRSQRTDGFYSVHNTEVWGEHAFSSWYSDGIVWWSFADPANPRKLGQFVPPATADPQEFFPTAPTVWGVAIIKKRNLLLASDINSGLWMVRPVAAAS